MIHAPKIHMPAAEPFNEAKEREAAEQSWIKTVCEDPLVTESTARFFVRTKMFGIEEFVKGWLARARQENKA